MVNAGNSRRVTSHKQRELLVQHTISSAGDTVLRDLAMREHSVIIYAVVGMIIAAAYSRIVAIATILKMNSQHEYFFWNPRPVSVLRRFLRSPIQWA